MMDQLGIRALRPGPSGNDTAPNHANYDESKANPFPNLPDVLTLNSGQKVTSAQMWWKQRRPEIVEDFEREVVGRVPKDTPKLTWTVGDVEHIMVGSYPAVSKKLIGHADNSSYPLINVDIDMTVVTPEHAAGPVPVMMMFVSGDGGRHRRRVRSPAPVQPQTIRRPPSSSLPMVGATRRLFQGAFKPTTERG